MSVVLNLVLPGLPYGAVFPCFLPLAQAGRKGKIFSRKLGARVSFGALE
jgi:hypothetical protein